MLQDFKVYAIIMKKGREGNVELSTMTTLIGTVGFPIACVIILFVYWNKEITLHREQSEKWMEALNNNTLVVQKLVSMIEEMRGERNGDNKRY